jgi:hypothetical protein
VRRSGIKEQLCPSCNRQSGQKAGQAGDETLRTMACHFNGAETYNVAGNLLKKGYFSLNKSRI